MKKKLMRWLLVLAVLLPCLIVGSMAAETVRLDLSQGSIALERTADGVQYTQGGTTVPAGDAVFLIRQSDTSAPTQNTITVSGGEVAVSVMGVNISSSTASPISVESGAHLLLTLLGDNTLKATGKNYAGLEVPAGAKLTVKGTGSLTATGGYFGAGIGGGANGDGGTITISGGEVTATGGYNGAGIGGGANGDGGTITITGGTITARTDCGGAGIGGGDEGNGGTITISGVEVVTHSIGAGNDRNGGTITITGGNIKCGSITVGGTVYFGSGDIVGGTISISGSTVAANTICGNTVAITESEATTKSGSISGKKITINGGTVTVTGSCYFAGGTYVYEGGRITAETILTINGGTITTEYGISGETIFISDGTVSVNEMYTRSDGISGGTITISGGTVTAVGASDYSGIRGETITISGGTVTARGGAYGICGVTVVIRDAEVTAAGDDYAIGSGNGCDSITISNATLNLEGGCREHIFDLELSDAVMALLPGSLLTMTTVAQGSSGVSYQWKCLSDRIWTDVAGQTSATLSIPMTAEMDGMSFRCKVTNGYGNVAYTDAAQVFALAFEQQPTPVEINMGEYAALEAKSTCENVSYHWERSYDNGVSWNVVPGEIYSTLLVEGSLSENGALYRCVITGTNGDQLASDAVPITVNTDDVTYTVKYYHQLPDGSGYGVAEQAVQASTTNSAVTAPSRTFEGFVENTGKGVHSGTVASDGSLVLSRYYDRKEYSITLDMMGGGALPALTARYGAEVAAPAAPVRYGFDFGGWYVDKELTTPYTFTTMPLNGTTVYAKWVNMDEGRGIEYQINSILFRDADSYEALDSIPTRDFLVEVSVTNLSSTHMDTVLFVSYDKDGRMLGFHYAFANPTIGQTMTFGTAIDNEDGQVAKVKVMVLSNLAGATPLAKAISGF